MNSVCMYVLDAVGRKWLLEFSTNDPSIKASFRKNAQWWMRGGFRKSKPEHQPCLPCRLVLEEYHDDTAY